MRGELIPVDVVIVLLERNGTCTVEYSDYLIKRYGDSCRYCPFRITPCIRTNVYTAVINYMTVHYPVELYKLLVGR